MKKIIKAYLLLFLFLSLTACSIQEKKKESGAGTEKASSVMETENPAYYLSSSGTGITAYFILGLCQKDDRVFVLAEDGKKTFLIQCKEDGTDPVRTVLPLEKKEETGCMEENSRDLYLLVYLEKKQTTEYYLKKIDSDGSIIDSHKLKLKNSEKEDLFFSGDTAVINEDGSLYTISGDGMGILFFDPEGNERKRISSNFRITSLLKTENDTVYAYGEGETAKEFKKLNEETGRLESAVSLEGYNILNEKVCAGEGNTIYIASQNNVYSFDLESGSLSPLFSWIGGGIDGTDIQDFLLLDDGSIFALAIPFGETAEITAVTAKKSDSSPQDTDKKVLTLASFTMLSGLKEAVLSFNQKSSQYQIQLREYSEYADPYTKMNLDIVSGKIPDIIVLNGIPADRYVKLGILTDLYPWMDSDKEISKDDFVDSILSAAEQDGKLYYFSPYFQIAECLAIGKSSLGSSEGLTIEDLETLYGQIPENGMLTTLPRQNFLSNMISYQIGDYIDEEDSKADFTSEYFIKVLNFAKKLKDSSEISSLSIDPNREIMEGRITAYCYPVNLLKIFVLNTLFHDKGGYEVFDYPAKERTDSLTAEFADTVLAISKACKDKEGAWEFVREFFTYDYGAKSASFSMWSFPSRKDVLEKILKRAMAEKAYTDEDGMEITPIQKTYGYDSFPISLKPLTKEDVSSVRSLIGRIKKMSHTSDDRQEQVLSIVREEAEAFFAGDKTAEETAEIIQNRVQLYLNETAAP